MNPERRYLAWLVHKEGKKPATLLAAAKDRYEAERAAMNDLHVLAIDSGWALSVQDQAEVWQALGHTPLAPADPQDAEASAQGRDEGGLSPSLPGESPVEACGGVGAGNGDPTQGQERAGEPPAPSTGITRPAKRPAVRGSDVQLALLRKAKREFTRQCKLGWRVSLQSISNELDMTLEDLQKHGIKLDNGIISLTS